MVPHALVEWEAIEDGASLEGLPTAARHTRVSLARACGLLEEGGLAATPSDLRAWFNRMLEECPADCRGSAAALREWAMAHGILLAPSGVVALRTGRTVGMRVVGQLHAPPQHMCLRLQIAMGPRIVTRSLQGSMMKTLHIAWQVARTDISLTKPPQIA